MPTNAIQILGISEATLSMILDNLQSYNSFPAIKVINNLSLTEFIPFENNAFDIEFLTKPLNISFVKDAYLGVYKTISKQKVFELYKNEDFHFQNCIHSSVSISRTSKLGYGNLINSLVSIAAHTTIENFVSINRNSSIGHHTVINDFVTINPGVTIAGHVTIGKGSVIGMGSIIMDGISIGENSIVGAGSLVTKNIPANVIAYGNPCKLIKANQVLD